MKKYLISLAVIAAFVAYFLWQRSNSNTDLTINQPTDTPTNSPLATSTPRATSTPGASPTPTPKATNNSGLKDGSYTSAVTDAVYGPLQIKVTISGGKISNVVFLQNPEGGHSSEVSNMALPLLKQEAIQSQSGNVQIVSGATQTSEAFQVAMMDVLSQAR